MWSIIVHTRIEAGHQEDASAEIRSQSVEAASGHRLADACAPLLMH